MNGCWMLNQPPPGRGGNVASDNHVIVRRTAALGDVLASTVVADRLIDLGYRVTFQAHESAHCILRRHRRLHAASIPSSPAHVDLDGAYENHPLRKHLHFSEIFFQRAQVQLHARKINLGRALNCTPRIYVSDEERAGIRMQFDQYPRPWVFICPRSQTYQARTVPDMIWSLAAPKINGTKFWIGLHPAPQGFVDLQARHVDNVIRWLSVADLLVTTDTGPMHVAAALRTPLVCLGQSSSPELHLSDQSDFSVLWPEGNLSCLNCQQNICHINAFQPPCQKFDPDKVATAVNARISTQGKVSAVVAIYKPDLNVVNRCIECVSPQVDEVILCAQGDSVIPQGIRTPANVKLVRTPKIGCGYSGNANHGVRHSTGEWLLLMNDDVYLKPDAVQKMKDCIRPDVATISNLLRYPDGSIYYSGKVRSPGVRAWGHANHRQHHPFFNDVTLVENACGCCILTRRSVFYDVNGLDEEMPIFAQDDDYSLKVRRIGWKILFTPHSEGTHLEHQSIIKLPGTIPSLLGDANVAFSKKWSWYFDKYPNPFVGAF